MPPPRALVLAMRAVKTAAEQRVSGARGLEQLETSPDTAWVRHRPVRCRTAKNWSEKCRSNEDRSETGSVCSRAEEGEWKCHAPSYADRAQGSSLGVAVQRGQGSYTTSGSGGGQRSDCLHIATPLWVRKGGVSHVKFKFHARTEGGMGLQEHANLES